MQQGPKDYLSRLIVQTTTPYIKTAVEKLTSTALEKGTQLGYTVAMKGSQMAEEALLTGRSVAKSTKEMAQRKKEQIYMLGETLHEQSVDLANQTLHSAINFADSETAQTSIRTGKYILNETGKLVHEVTTDVIVGLSGMTDDNMNKQYSTYSIVSGGSRAALVTTLSTLVLSKLPEYGISPLNTNVPVKVIANNLLRKFDHTIKNSNLSAFSFDRETNKAFMIQAIVAYGTLILIIQNRANKAQSKLVKQQSEYSASIPPVKSHGKRTKVISTAYHTSKNASRGIKQKSFANKDTPEITEFKSKRNQPGKGQRE